MGKFDVEQFPDGIYGVPALLFGEGARTIGSSLVTFKDGLWSASIQLTDETVRELGVTLTFETLETPFGTEKAIVLKPHEDVEFVRELRKRWR